MERADRNGDDGQGSADAVRGSSELDLTIVVPFYNAGSQLLRNINALAQELDSTGLRYEVIAVSDGSTDGSDLTLEPVLSDKLRRFVLPRHQGKGEALRVGFNDGTGEYLGFIDADGDIPAALISSFVDAIKEGDVDIVVGSKRHELSDVVYPPLRRMYSWGYQQLVRILFDLNVRDTQTGLKILRRDVLREVLPLTLEKRFCFDLELLVVANQLGYRHIAELPVRIERKFGSTISIKAVFGILADTLVIWWRQKVRRQYRRKN